MFLREFNCKLLLSAAAYAVTAGGAYAQQAETSDDDGKRLDTIVVSAEKRGDQTLLDTAISIGVLSNETLESGGVSEISDVLNNLGGVNIVKVGAGNNSISIRGAAVDDVFGGASTVGYYLDEASLGFVRSAIVPDTNSFDMERVEVLRGPQGTLYGASSLNGVVRVITKDADLDDFEVKTRAGISSTSGGSENYRGDIAVNVPVVPGKLAVRGVVSYDDYSGWIDAPSETDLFGLGGAKNVNGGTSETYRLKVNAQPTDTLSVELGAWISRVEAQSTNRANDDGNTTLFGAGENGFQDLDIFTFEINKDFGSFNLLSATSYSEYNTYGTQNIKLSGIVPLTVTPNKYGAEKLHQELRLTSQLEGDWQWSLGGMYRKSEERLIQGAPAFFLNALLDGKDYSEAWALFGEVNKSFYDGLADITVGLRYFEDTIEIEELSSLVPRGFLVNEETSFDTLTPRIVLSVHPQESMTLYASYSKGFRSGILQSPTSVATDPTSDFRIKPDEIHNYEFGLKGALYDGRLVYDLALYYLDWTDIQQRSISPIGGSVVRNTGDASGHGLDLGITAKVTKGFTVGLSAGWNNIETSREDAGAGVLLFGIGDRVNKSPEFTGSLSADYEFPMGDSNMMGRFSGSVRYNSAMDRRDFVAGTIVPTESDELLTGRMSFDVEMDNGVGVSLYANNIFDEDGAIQPRLITADFEAPRLRPRTIGVQLSYDF
ncbi:TonB-dependent receptor [Hirschia maritima]|uniref:TonB-dependent receptor n=1 Tax=Hirschia maritima TaxID=1121961 RepID=UPI00037A1898|nr:TonB-dependent receptor [Hirschia maritima]